MSSEGSIAAVQSNDVGSSKVARAEYPAKLEKLVAGLISFLLLTGIGWVTNQGWIKWIFAEEVFLRLAVLIALVFGAIIAAHHIWSKSTVPRATWWNIGGKLNDPSWLDVLRMTVGEPADDPVAYESPHRPFATGAKSVGSYVILGCLLIEAVSLVVSGPIIPRLRPEQSTDTDGLSANLTALLALSAAAVSIYFTYRQLQAKVRADSRQAWIDKLRTHISAFIALADPRLEANEVETTESCGVEFTKRRIEMELMLNPSEKDHRLLMYLSLRLAFFHSGEDWFSKIHDVRNVRKVIQNDPDYKQSDWVVILGPIPAKKSKNYKLLHSDLIGYTMRLAHVVLKREWQRVKVTK